MLSPDPLQRLAKALSLESAQLIRVDESNMFVVEAPIQGNRLAATLQDGDLQQLLLAYGAAVRVLEVRLSDATRLNVLQETNLPDAIDALLQDLDADETYAVVCTIDKRQLVLRTWPTAFENTNLRVYFYAETVEQLLRRPLTFLEDLLWPEGGSSKAVIVVIDSAAAMAGDFLAVIGASTNLPAVAVSDESATEYAKWMASIAPQIVHWDREWPRALTPRHMFVHHDGPSIGPVYRILRDRLTDLSLLYLCDLTRERNGAATSFLFAKETVEIPWSSLATNSDDFAPGVVSLVEWVYDSTYRESYLQDRRALAKENIARLLLAEADESRRYPLFAANATTIRADSDAQWKAFRTKALTDYFRDLADVEKDASATAQSYADQTSTLTRALADSLVTAAAALVAAMAAVVARPVSVEWVLRIIYGAYAVLTIGAGALNLSQVSGRARSLQAEFRLRTTRMRGVIAPERMVNPDQIESSSRARFWRWFWLVTVLYVVIVISASVAALTAPGPLGPLLVAPTATAIPAAP